MPLTTGPPCKVSPKIQSLLTLLNVPHALLHPEPLPVLEDDPGRRCCGGTYQLQADFATWDCHRGARTDAQKAPGDCTQDGGCL